ncbi:class I SAM-dependent DNA methyltransferase, partial [Sphingomonas sp. UYP23]
DPACGSGNFLVIAYKEMRRIEATIVERLGGEKNLKLDERRSVIPLDNFYGIEIKGFAAEIARLALLIAEFQADCLYLSQQEARAMVLPLHRTGQIYVDNALQIDWLKVCPPFSPLKEIEYDLGGATGRLALEDNSFADNGTETYLCGNPPYSGYNKQSVSQKNDLGQIFSPLVKRWGNLDYVTGWFAKAAQQLQVTGGAAAFVSTNTICQGGQVPILWPLILSLGQEIGFAHTSFKWANLAANNAGITVIIVGIRPSSNAPAVLFEENISDITVRKVDNINGYLAAARDIFVYSSSIPISQIAKMNFGNHPYYGADLIISNQEARDLINIDPHAAEFIRPYYGSTEVIYASPRMCIWVKDVDAHRASAIPALKIRFDAVLSDRKAKPGDASATALVSFPHRFRDQVESRQYFIAVPQTSSENRPYLPCDIIAAPAVVSFKCFAIHDAPLWNLALIASRLHWAWIGAVCARLEMRFSYSNTLGWNTFPVPKLTEQNKADLTRTAENILLAREAHFPATIADLYDPETMPDDLRRAHEDNDEVLERIYIGRRFRNDTERLEKLFDLYTKMTADAPKAKKGKKAA